MGETNIDTLIATAVKLGAMTLPADAANFDALGGVTAGVASASSVAILGTNKNLDTLVIADGGLKLGSGAGTAVTATAAELNKAAGIPATSYQQVAASRDFTETGGAGTYTATVVIPAGAWVLDVLWHNIAVWTAATSATLNVGDADTSNGYFAGIDLKAAPVADTAGMGGVSSAKGDTGAGAFSGKTKYYASAGLITATVVTVGTTGTAGRSRMLVRYVTPTSVAAVKA